MQKPSIPKGTRDFNPAEVMRRRYILQIIESVFQRYGFMPIETPAMENLTTLEGKYGAEGDKLLFRIINSGDAFKTIREQHAQTKMADMHFQSGDISEKGLRYDLTVPFARYVVMHRNEITFPFKRYQMQPVWRADRPQKGRYREFWQCDADVVGSSSLIYEAELIQLYADVFEALDLKVEIKFNNRKLLDGLAQLLGIPEKVVEMTTILDKADKVGLEQVFEELRSSGANPEHLERFRACLNESSDTKKLESFFGNNETAQTGLKELKQIEHALDLSKNNNPDRFIHVRHDLALARGLSYYTGAIFEVVATEGSLRSSIGGGGRYDNLTGIFGLQGVSGVGISFGLDRICDVMEELGKFEKVETTSTRVLICALDETSQDSGIGLLRKLRDSGIASELFPEIKKIGKQLDYANARKIPYAVLIGEKEREEGKVILKDLVAGSQELLSPEQTIERLKS